MALRYLAGKTVMVAGEAMLVMRPLQVRRNTTQSGSKGNHAVISETLKQLERDCETISPVNKKTPLQKVTILNASSDVGIITSLFLKQQSIIKYLAMYDDISRKVIGHAHDLAHIDTTTAVEAYQGRKNLKAALDGADVILICGCSAKSADRKCWLPDNDLFLMNQTMVRNYATAIAFCNPGAMVCVQTPPVDCNFTLCKYMLKKYNAYNKRRLLGVNALAAMRANQLYCALEDHDPTRSYCPCVCGTGCATVVPVFSGMDRYVCKDPKDIEKITRLVREADQIICRANSCCEAARLSAGFSTARFILNVMKGLLISEKDGFIDSALVEQAAPDQCYGMKYCACPVTISDCHVLKLCLKFGLWGLLMAPRNSQHCQLYAVVGTARGRLAATTLLPETGVKELPTFRLCTGVTVPSSEAGISSYLVPRLNAQENEMLETSKPILEALLKLGKDQVMDDGSPNIYQCYEYQDQ